jgi:5-methylcytosine-specific restriction endonuclease McrA
VDISLGSTAQLDHIIPLSLGGPNALSNLSWCHAMINRAKANIPLDKFIKEFTAVALGFLRMQGVGQAN